VLSFIRRSAEGDSLGAILSLAVKLKAADPQRRHLLGKNAIQAQLPFLQAEHIDLVFRELS
jgi:hypothetical protein